MRLHFFHFLIVSSFLFFLGGGEKKYFNANYLEEILKTQALFSVLERWCREGTETRHCGPRALKSRSVPVCLSSWLTRTLLPLGALNRNHRRCNSSHSDKPELSVQLCRKQTEGLLMVTDLTAHMCRCTEVSPLSLSAFPRASRHGTSPCWGPSFTLLESKISLSGMGLGRSQENGNQKVLPVLQAVFPTTTHQLYKPRHRFLSDTKNTGKL